MNQIIIIGNCTRDIELKELQGGQKLANMTLAVNRRFKDKQGNRETDFFNVTLWGKTAELANQYLKKGSKCLVRGEMQIRKYTDKDGNQKISPEINGDEIEFLSQAQQQTESFSPNVRIEEDDFSEDEIPF